MNPSSKISLGNFSVSVLLFLLSFAVLWPRSNSAYFHIDEIFWICTDENWLPTQNIRDIQHKIPGTSYFSNGPVAKYLFQGWSYVIRSPGQFAAIECSRWPRYYADKSFTELSPQIHELLVKYRLLIAVLGSMCISVAFIFGKQLVNNAFGLIYAALLFINPIFQEAATHVLSEIPFLLIFLVSMHCLYWLFASGWDSLQKISKRHIIITTFLIVVTSLIKPAGFILIYFVLSLSCLLYLRHEVKKTTKVFLSKHAALFTGTFIASFVGLYPALFIPSFAGFWWLKVIRDTAQFHAYYNPFTSAADRFDSMFEKIQVVIADLLFPGLQTGLLSKFPFVLLFTVVGVIALIVIIRKKSHDSMWFTASFILLAGAIFVICGFLLLPVHWVRYYLSLFLPVLLLIEAYGIWHGMRIFQRLKRKYILR